MPGTWLVYQAADIAARPFLHQLDFSLHFPSHGSAATLSRTALEAAAAGCVVVLPERSAALFGDAAVYAEAADVPAVIRRFAAQPELFAEQSRRARAVVAKAHHPQLFVDRITELIRNGVAGGGVTDVSPAPDLVKGPAR